MWDGRKRWSCHFPQLGSCHLFPGIGLPAPTHPQSGNSFTLGLCVCVCGVGGGGWGLHGSFSPQEAWPEAATATTLSRLPILMALAGQLLPTVLGTGKMAGPRQQCPGSTTAQPWDSPPFPTLAWLASLAACFTACPSLGDEARG